MSEASPEAVATANAPDRLAALKAALAPTAATTTAGLQYLRRAQLTIGTDSGDALDVSQLRLRFSIAAGDVQTPKTLDARVYNISDATAQLIQTEGAPVRLSVGYGDGALSTIFNGNVMFLRRGRENPVDTYLDLVCADGDAAYIGAVVNTTLAAGHTPADVATAACTKMNPYGVTLDDTSALPATSAPRGRAIYGMARSTLRDVTKSTDTSWHVEDGSLKIMPAVGYRSDEAVVLTSATGMIGIPQQTPDGIVVRALLNPKFRIGGKLQIANKDIQQARVGTSVQEKTGAAFLPRISEDGFYRILLVQHRGDTRGEEWFSDLICIAGDDPQTASFTARAYLTNG